MRKLKEVLRLHSLGMSQHQIARMPFPRAHPLKEQVHDPL